MILHTLLPVAIGVIELVAQLQILVGVLICMQERSSPYLVQPAILREYYQAGITRKEGKYFATKVPWYAIVEVVRETMLAGWYRLALNVDIPTFRSMLDVVSRIRLILRQGFLVCFSTYKGKRMTLLKVLNVLNFILLFI